MLGQKYTYLVVRPGTIAYEEYSALRHEVFCAELGRVASAAQGSGQRAVETDEFDENSVHVLCRSTDTGEAVGCARLILPSPRGINVLARYQLDSDGGIDSRLVGEIGRLAISSKLRRYRRSTRSLGQAMSAGNLDDLNAEIRRDGPIVALGLYRELFRLANQHGITHCYAAMEASLSRMLNRLGFPFHAAGPVNHAVTPARQPYIIGAHTLRAGLASRNSCLSKFLFGFDESPAAHLQGLWPAMDGGRVPATA